MCLYPRLIQNRKYIANKKNGGLIPTVNDERTLLVAVGCGKCIECMKKKAREWQIRMSEEIRHDKSGKFVTLTFDKIYLKELTEIVLQEQKKKGIKDNNKKIIENEIAKSAVRRFLERWRKQNKKSVKHWLCTELGHTGTERIHLHGVIFTNKSKEEIEKLWKYGMIWVGEYVNEKTINYIIKYIHKIDKDHKGYTPKVLCSAGIGKNYIERIDSKNNKYVPRETNEAYKYRNGTKGSLPIYYRNKIYTEEQREKLWIEKIDQEIRYVNGIKIDISKDEKEYYRVLQEAREQNQRLGYGDDSKTWTLEEYLKQREKLKKLKE